MGCYRYAKPSDQKILLLLKSFGSEALYRRDRHMIHINHSSITAHKMTSCVVQKRRGIHKRKLGKIQFSSNSPASRKSDELTPLSNPLKMLDHSRGLHDDQHASQINRGNLSFNKAKNVGIRDVVGKDLTADS